MNILKENSGPSRWCPAPFRDISLAYKRQKNEDGGFLEEKQNLVNIVEKKWKKNIKTNFLYFIFIPIKMPFFLQYFIVVFTFFVKIPLIDEENRPFHE